MLKKLYKTIALTCAFALAAIATNNTASATPIPDSAKINGFAVGPQSYTFHRKYSAWESVEKAKEAGATVIEFYPGQAFCQNDKTPFGHNCPPEKIQKMKEHLKKNGIRAVNYGVVDIPKDETNARKIFEFAKALELYAITTESDRSIDTIEKLAKEYDIRVGFHNHPRQKRNPNYKVWDAKYIRDLVKDRDPHLGAAADIGHWTTDGFSAVENLKILEGRIVSVHAKDRLNVGYPVQNVPLGKGIIGIPSVLAELQRQNFSGNISIEHEADWQDNVGKVKESIAFIREYKTK